MIETTYESPRYNPKNAHVRYVRYDPIDKVFRWSLMCVRSMYDVKQGTCDETDLPSTIAARARKLGTTWPSYIDWPL